MGVSDGDTITVLQGGRIVKIRLYGVDAPERTQSFGTRAKQFTSGMLFSHDADVLPHTGDLQERLVGMVVDVRMHSVDLYDRLVGEVFTPDGKSLHHELVREGLAWWYETYAKNDTVLSCRQADAQAAKRGLWSDPDPIAPWEWRQIQRTYKRAQRERPVEPEAR